MTAQGRSQFAGSEMSTSLDSEFIVDEFSQSFGLKKALTSIENRETLLLHASDINDISSSSIRYEATSVMSGGRSKILQASRPNSPSCSSEFLAEDKSESTFDENTYGLLYANTVDVPASHNTIWKTCPSAQSLVDFPSLNSDTSSFRQVSSPQIGTEQVSYPRSDGPTTPFKALTGPSPEDRGVLLRSQEGPATYSMDGQQLCGSLTGSIGHVYPNKVDRLIGPQKKWTLPPRAARGRKPKIPSSDGKGKKQEVRRSTTRPGRRGPLPPAVRESALWKRHHGLVCVICHFKKEACTFDVTASEGPCLKCKALITPCVRYRVTDAALYREQEAPFYLLSRRWKSMAMVDITQWASDEIRTIHLSQSFLHAPYEVKVRRFVPLPGDVLEESWDSGGKTVTFAVPPYGIANMEEVADSIAKMIEREVGNYLRTTVGRLEIDELIWETYLAAFRRASIAPTVQEKALLFDSLRLWVCCRMTSHPEKIVGDDHLETSAVEDPVSPLHQLIPPSPVLGAQLECIHYTRFLRPLSKNVLRSLLSLMESKEKRYWLTIYLVLFMILHSCSMMTQRDMEVARENTFPTVFCNPDSIKAQQTGVKTLLAHFHLALKGSLPFKLSLEDRLQDYASFGALAREEIELIVKSGQKATRYKSEWDQIRRKEAWEHDFYWISQLYDHEWKPDKMD